MAYRTIVLKDVGLSVPKERNAGASIKPGMLVLRHAATDKVIPHATAGGHALPAFARENELEGKGVDTAYASGARVLYNVYKTGQEVAALVAAGADAIANSDPLESAGDGTLRKRTGTNAIIGYALEALDNSGGGEDVLLGIEVA